MGDKAFPIYSIILWYFSEMEMSDLRNFLEIFHKEITESEMQKIWGPILDFHFLRKGGKVKLGEGGGKCRYWQVEIFGKGKVNKGRRELVDVLLE